jgi:hypothetical protein
LSNVLGLLLLPVFVFYMNRFVSVVWGPRCLD